MPIATAAFARLHRHASALVTAGQVRTAINRDASLKELLEKPALWTQTVSIVRGVISLEMKILVVECVFSTTV